MMEILIDKRYPLTVGSDCAWSLLCDMPSIAACMPGAELTDRVGENQFKGKVKVKIGPATVSFNGEIEMLQIDCKLRQIQMNGNGVDKGGSFASLNLTARIEPAENAVTSVLVGQAKVNIKGKFAQYGEHVMIQMSNMILSQFVDNFIAATSTLSSHAGAVPIDKSAIHAAIPKQNRELNALTMLWRLIKSWFGRWAKFQ